MPLVIATDEAGYGPKLGPLVIASSAWWVDPMTVDDDEDSISETTGQLAQRVQRCITGRQLRDGTVPLVEDSKQLFKPKVAGALQALERPIVAWMKETSVKPFPATLCQLIRHLAVDDFEALANQPWYQNLRTPFPIDSSSEDASCWTFATQDRRSPIRLLSVLARIIEPGQFNRDCQRLGNKATLLSETTVELAHASVRSAIALCDKPSEPISIFSDRHGGRHRYAGLLQHLFPNQFVHVISESSRNSCYRIDRPAGPVEWQFTVKGDAFAPVAFSSMIAKYLRERLMERFNDFWIANHPNSLKPTAGYPTDANRFCREVAKVARGLGIHDSQYIRVR
jgi:ribonuclease HII